MKKYHVLRQHYGDRQYWAGGTREMRESDAKRLLKMGVLAEEKAAKKPENKQAAKPENKAD